MIHTSRQLKALVRNISDGNSAKAQIIIRNYVMERFLERLSLSQYRNNLILKGGTLVAAMVGIDNRSTMDVDATVKNLPLSVDKATDIVKDIVAIPIDDSMSFEIKDISPIMDEANYPGIRIALEATLETMRTPLKIDLSTGDVITPHEIVYSFKLLFEEREISILAYNLETVLAEKLETILSRAMVNTRMRDFYDIYILETTQLKNIDSAVLREAFANTGNTRGLPSEIIGEADLILKEIELSSDMLKLWTSYQNKFDYAADISWNEAMGAVKRLWDRISL